MELGDPSVRDPLGGAWAEPVVLLSLAIPRFQQTVSGSQDVMAVWKHTGLVSRPGTAQLIVMAVELFIPCVCIATQWGSDS